VTAPVGSGTVVAPINSGTATTPIGSGTLAPSGTAVIVLPAGSFISLQSALRTQGAIPPSDLSPADLAKLIIEVDGRRLTPSEYEITRAEYNAAGEIVLTISFKNPPASPKPLRIASPDGRITLLGTTAKDGAPAQVDVRSTAQSLLQQLLKTTISEADRKTFEDAIAKAIIDMLTSSQVRKLAADSEFNGLLQRIAGQIETGKPLTKDLLALIITPPSKGGGGGQTFALPTITSVNPASGTLTSPVVSTITVNGTNFVTGNTTVNWGATAGTAVNVTSTTQLTTSVNFNVGGTRALTVTTPGGTSAAFNYNVE
jgi:hypothetical protein